MSRSAIFEARPSTLLGNDQLRNLFIYALAMSCRLRGGIYQGHAVNIENLRGTAENPFVVGSYADEEAIFAGTVDIHPNCRLTHRLGSPLFRLVPFQLTRHWNASALQYRRQIAVGAGGSQLLRWCRIKALGDYARSAAISRRGFSSRPGRNVMSVTLSDERSVAVVRACELIIVLVYH